MSANSLKTQFGLAVAAAVTFVGGKAEAQSAQGTPVAVAVDASPITNVQVPVAISNETTISAPSSAAAASSAELNNSGNGTAVSANNNKNKNIAKGGNAQQQQTQAQDQTNTQTQGNQQSTAVDASSHYKAASNVPFAVGAIGAALVGEVGANQRTVAISCVNINGNMVTAIATQGDGWLAKNSAQMLMPKLSKKDAKAFGVQYGTAQSYMPCAETPRVNFTDRAQPVVTERVIERTKETVVFVDRFKLKPAAPAAKKVVRAKTKKRPAAPPQAYTCAPAPVPMCPIPGQPGKFKPATLAR